MKISIVLFNLLASTVFFGTAISGNNEGHSCEELVQKLVWVEGANPDKDAEHALARGQRKYMAVGGYILYIPGTASTEYFRATSEKDYSLIEGTSDGFCNERHKLLNDRAFKYAESYNTYIIEHWR